MTYREILNQLEGLGTEQNRKTFMRHGSGQDTFGVSFANLRRLAKGIGIDQDLAVALWDSKNTDARSLALLIADPQSLTIKFVEAWLKDVEYSVLVGLLCGLIGKTNFAKRIISKWIKAKNTKFNEAGFVLLSHWLKIGESIELNDLENYLVKIRKDIGLADNRNKLAMNNALIAIGIYTPSLTNKAINFAKEIGKVEVDHGNTSCKTPDAYTYIVKGVLRKKERI